MLRFDSDEYWLAHRWDRDQTLRDTHPRVASILLEQEELTFGAVENALQRLATRSGAQCRILDLGCGMGRIPRLLAERYGAKVSITLADINPTTLLRATQQLPAGVLEGSTSVSIYDAGNVWNREFDIVLCMDVFHHLTRLDLALRSIAKSVSSGGFLIGNVFLSGEYRAFDRKKYGILGSLRRGALCALGSSLHRLPVSRLARLIRRRGWSRISPVDRDYFLGILTGSFDICSQDEGVYLWFQATVC